MIPKCFLLLACAVLSVIDSSKDQLEPMPKLTFCMSKNQALSFIPTADDPTWDKSINANLALLSTKEQFLTKKWDYRMIKEGYFVILTLTDVERHTSILKIANGINSVKRSRMIKTIKLWLTEIEKRQVSFHEFMQKVGTEALNYESQLQKFGRNINGIDIRASLRISWISQVETCFQPMFLDGELEHVGNLNFFFNLIVAIPPNKKVSCMSVDLHGRPSKLSRLMEGEQRAKDGYNDNLCFGTEINLEISLDKLNQVGGDCTNYDETMEFDCKSRCRLRTIQELCNCNALTLMYLVPQEQLLQYRPCDYEQCNPNPEKFTFSETQCINDCKPACTQKHFKIALMDSGTKINGSVSSVNLHWRNSA